MRKALLMTVALLCVASFLASAADEPFFDLQKCAFCKTLADQPGLLDHMKTQYHKLHNGTMSITHIDKEYQPGFAKALEAMKPVVQDLQAGKKVYTCPHCTMLGQLYMAGVMPDEVKSGDDIMEVYTSTDSTMVKKLQEFGEKSNEGLAALAAKPK